MPGSATPRPIRCCSRVGHGRGAQVARELEERNIVVNYQALPDDESFTASSGLRMGVSEMTRFGMGEDDFAEFAGLMAAALRDEAGIAEKVSEFRGRFQKMRFCFDESAFGDVQERLLRTF